MRARNRSGVAFVVAMTCGACTSILGDFSGGGPSADGGSASPSPEAGNPAHDAGPTDGATDTSTLADDSSEGDGGEDSSPSFAADASCDGGPCVTAVSANGYHTCALMADQTVTCWGDNNWGQAIWNGPVPSVTRPTTVTFPDGGPMAPAKEVRVGDRHTCVLLVDGSVWCWGDDTQGQIGATHLGFAPDASQFPAPPTEVYGPGSVAELYVGLYHSCVELQTDSGLSPVYCWGGNGWGEVGVADAAVVPTPVQLSIPQFERIALGAYMTCVLKSSTAAECFGLNNYGQLGRGVPPDAAVGPNGAGTDSLPHPVAAPVAPLPGNDIQYNNALPHGTGAHYGATLVGGGLALWGDNASSQLGPQVDAAVSAFPTIVDIDDVSEVTMLQQSTCALRSDGTVYCWGSTEFGQNGTSTTITATQPVPTPVTGITSAVGLTAGLYHACALLVNGTVACWGDNANAQLGFSDAGFSATPGIVQF